MDEAYAGKELRLVLTAVGLEEVAPRALCLEAGGCGDVSPEASSTSIQGRLLLPRVVVSFRQTHLSPISEFMLA